MALKDVIRRFVDNSVYSDKYYAVDATYTDKKSQSAINIRVLFREGGTPEERRPSTSHVGYGLVKRSDVATPLRGDRITIGQNVWTVATITSQGLNDDWLLKCRKGQETT